MSALETIRERAGDAPIRLGLILGSGLGAMAQEMKDAVRIPFEEIPDFPRSGVTGHAGELSIGTLSGTRCAILSGRAHYYEHGDPAVMRPAIEALQGLGAEALVLTNSAGSTREEMPVGSLMAISDHISWSGRTPLIGEQGDARFVTMADAYDPELRARLLAVARAQEIPLAEGVYAWFSGPTFETPAEIRAIRMLGADAVGMSTVPETILARRAGLPVVAVSVITNLAAGMTGQALSHLETKTEAAKAQARFIDLIRAFLGSFA